MGLIACTEVDGRGTESEYKYERVHAGGCVCGCGSRELNVFMNMCASLHLWVSEFYVVVYARLDC